MITYFSLLVNPQWCTGVAKCVVKGNRGERKENRGICANAWQDLTTYVQSVLGIWVWLRQRHCRRQRRFQWQPATFQVYGKSSGSAAPKQGYNAANRHWYFQHCACHVCYEHCVYVCRDIWHQDSPNTRLYSILSPTARYPQLIEYVLSFYRVALQTRRFDVVHGLSWSLDRHFRASRFLPFSRWTSTTHPIHTLCRISVHLVRFESVFFIQLYTLALLMLYNFPTPRPLTPE